MEGTFDFAAAPQRSVYIHAADEHSVDDAELSRIPFMAVPSNITDAAGFKQWLDSMGVTDILTSHGWARVPEPPQGSKLLDSFRYHVRRAAVATDRTVEWAHTVLRPFPYSVVDLDGLRKAMAEPLPLRLPIARSTYQSLDRDVAAFFVPYNEYPAESMSAPISGFMTVAYQTESTWDMAFCNLWCMLALPTQITFDRNVTDPSGASASEMRPDLMMWARNRLAIKFEEKRRSLYAAYLDLVKKIQNLPAIFFGPVQWIVGVGLAGPQMQVWAVRQGSVPDGLTQELNMASKLDRAKCLNISINFLRLALTLTEVLGTLISVPRPYCRLQTSKYGREEDIWRDLVIASPRVLKTIRPWSKHVAEGFTAMEYVRQAYLIRVPQLISGKIRYFPEEDEYVAGLSPVGYEEVVAKEDELRQAIMAVLMGLRALHEVDLVHRDVRWKNILRTSDGGWMLIDLETVWKNCEEPSCSLRAWDSHTLVAGMYTERSDLYLVGKLMDPFTQLSAPAVAFRTKLLDKFYDSADSALEDAWLGAIAT